MPKGIIRKDINGLIICEICNKSYKKLISHVIQAHEISGDEYREQFGFCKSTAFMCEDSKVLARKKQYPHYTRVVLTNLVEKGKKTRVLKGHHEFNHSMCAERYLILEKTRSLKPVKPKAKCLICKKELSTRKSKLCLKHYRAAMSLRNRRKS